MKIILAKKTRIIGLYGKSIDKKIQALLRKNGGIGTF